MAYKNNAVGQKAQNFDLTISENDKTTTLYDLNIAEEYLIIFWSSTCGHCLEELPKVKSFLTTKPKVKVIAIGLEDEARNWEKAINDYPDFIHVLGLGKWNNSIVNAYDVSSTPTYVLLDNNKTIIAKPNDLEALKKVLE
ncbi:MAG: thioredoxin family protein [Psychroserpens sp.]|nr:thioredoxin family protein [Psychroserpens sp.]